MKNIRYRLSIKVALLATALLVSSCTGMFEKYNTNPDEVTEDQMNGDNYKVGAFFPQMQMNVIPVHEHRYQVSQNLAGDIYCGYMAGIGEWDQGKNGTTFFWKDTWLDIPFQDVFVAVIAADQQVRKTSTADHILAFSTILKVASIHRLTDLYGPMPYSEIAKTGSLTVAYDSQEMVYKQLLTDLTNAINALTIFADNNQGKTPMQEYDLVYGGDYNKWLKFANSLKLRMAMRCSNVDKALAEKNVREALAHPKGVILSNADNAALKSGNGIVIKNPIETMWNTYSDCRMGALMQSILGGYEDPRLPLYFQSTTVGSNTGCFGARTGVQVTNKTAYLPYSTPRGYFNDPMVWMTAAEVSFLKAEGALRGWVADVTAEEAYNNGIKLSFEEKGVDPKFYTPYISDDTKIPAHYSNKIHAAHSSAPTCTTKIKWTASTFEKNLEQIITQKWIALYPNGAEAWSEVRRTGYPKQFPAINNFSNGTVDSNKGAQRIPFPPSEYLMNLQNIQKATMLLGGPDTGGTDLWWDKIR